MFLYVIQSNCWIYFILVCFLYISCAWFIPPLHHCYILVCINIFVNVISIVTAIFLCTSYDLILGCAAFWELCYTYFLYIVCYPIFVIIVDLHSKRWINISFFELVVTCIKLHIFVPSFSISRIFISIIKFFYFLSLLLGQIFPLNILHPKTCIQHSIYTIFEKISSFSSFIFSHTRIQRVTLITKKGVLSSIC